MRQSSLITNPPVGSPQKQRSSVLWFGSAGHHKKADNVENCSANWIRQRHHKISATLDHNENCFVFSRSSSPCNQRTCHWLTECHVISRLIVWLATTGAAGTGTKKANPGPNHDRRSTPPVEQYRYVTHARRLCRGRCCWFDAVGDGLRIRVRFPLERFGVSYTTHTRVACKAYDTWQDVAAQCCCVFWHLSFYPVRREQKLRSPLWCLGHGIDRISELKSSHC